MRILGAAGERRVVAAVDRVLEVGADVRPALAKLKLAWETKHAVGELGSAEAGEPDQRGLLVDRGRTLLIDDRGGEPDRRDVVAGALPPGFGETARAGEMEVLAIGRPAQELSIRRGGHGRRGRMRGRVVIVRIVGRTVGKGGHAKAET